MYDVLQRRRECAATTKISSQKFHSEQAMETYEVGDDQCCSIEKEKQSTLPQVHVRNITHMLNIPVSFC